MTPAEKSAVTRRGLLYGLWCGVSIALPLQLIALEFVTSGFNWKVVGPCGLLILAHLVGIPIWQRQQRRFLCGTTWARDHQITPQSLRLFAWRRRNSHTK